MSVLDAILQPKLAAEGLRPRDGVADMTHISDIDVEGINENLLVRYNRDEIYTYTGTILVAVNPYKFLKIYEGEMVERYSGKKMGEAPPHVFATAEAAFLNVRNSDQNQSCVISGESGAGKTETTKFILQYLCTVTDSVTKWVEQQILEANTILEAFGNARTVRNDNSSRFGKFMQVCFNTQCEIMGCIIQEYLLEQSRITFQAKEERNYHVFYQLVKGGDKEKFLLEDAKSYKYLNKSGCYDLEGVDDTKAYEDLRMAMTVMNIDEPIQDGVFALVSAVLYVGNLEFNDVDGESVSLTSNDVELARRIAVLLKVTPEQIQEVLTTRQIFVRGTVTSIPFKLRDAVENANAMAKALYSRTFTWLVDKINQTTNPGKHTSKFIGVLDIFGFENFAENSFEQLCINFTNEKLHKFFNHYVFALEQAEYEREQINFSHIQFTDNTSCLELIEKPPKCVLRLLDEECRFPKGTDNTYLAKQHEALSGHPHYIKGEVKSRWDSEFGVLHFAGAVVYKIDGFLDKNKDVMQDQLFEYMRMSGSEFVRDVTKFQNLLASERKMIMGRKLRSSETGSETIRTNKAKPTVGDTFRRQLQALVEILEDTTPWYVRCIKPNSSKSPGSYNKRLVEDQLRYSGMLDIVRIRKEGFPVHVPAEDFVRKYHAMARVMGKKLDPDPKQAVRQIMEYIKAPETEWQIGLTKVFLRNSIFDPLEEKLRDVLQQKIVLIQKVWRGQRQRKKYTETKLSIIRIQAAVRGAVNRLRYLQQRRAAVKIQAAARGWRDREFVRELLRKKKEEEEKRKREQEEARRRAAEEQGEALMEDSFLQAQRELMAMAKLAEMKASEVNKPGQDKAVDLDNMFKYLAEDKHEKKEEASLQQINSELDAMFAGEEPQAAGKRTMRRRKRVEKKMLYEEQQEQAVKAEETVNPSEYAMLAFAQKYFNAHPKGGAAGSTRKSVRSDKVIADPMPKDEMIFFTKNPNIPTSLVHMHNPHNVNLACSIWKDIHKHMKGDLKPEQSVQSIQSIVGWCLERDELRNEIYCQLIRQTTNNPKPESQIMGWQFLAICCVCFPPGKVLYKYLQSYIIVSCHDSIVGGYAKYALDALKRTKFNGIRRHPPSRLEVEAVQKLQPIICRFYFLDGKAKAVGVHAAAIASDVISDVARKIGLRSTDGWALFESKPKSEHFIRGQEYIGDILAEWETAKHSSVQMTRYSTISRKAQGTSKATSAIGGGDVKFVFRKRLFKNPQDIPSDPVEYGLLYAQAVCGVVVVDEFPVNEKVALQLAGLQAQILWGDAEESKKSRYDEVESFLPWRIREGATPKKTKEDWIEALFKAHSEFGTGRTDLQAKVMYLTAVKQYPLYGGTFFEVQYKGFWSFPNRLVLSIHENGFKFVNNRTKAVMAEFPYSLLKNVEVNAYEDTLTLHMEPSPDVETTHYMFLCERKDDVANLIASYSPQHRNWKQVGVAAVAKHKASDDDKARLLNEVRQAREKLADSGMLKKPPEASRGFIATTLRRVTSKNKLEPRRSSKGLALEPSEFERTFDGRYWSYQKSRLTQPLSVMASEEGEEIAIRMFNSLLVFAGLVQSGGYEQEGDPGQIVLIQNVIGRCLEKEDVCNEFYLQLIKQTTDQPDPNGRINVQNWRFVCLTLGVVVPRNKLLLNYIGAHLRRCALEPNTEEGKFAQFAQQCLLRTQENKNRKYPPSTQEIMCVAKRSPVYARFYFMDGEFRALMFDAAASTAEVVAMVKERVGLHPTIQGFSLFEVFGSLERNMLAWEKVADAIFKWEKYAKSTHSQKELRLTFKKRIFLGPFGIPKHPVEFDLVFHQAIDDVRNDRMPVTSEECAYLAALRAHVELGPLNPNAIESAEKYYRPIIDKYLPKHMRSMVQAEEIAAHHVKMRQLSPTECNVRFLQFVMDWPLYGSTIFEVLQSYTSTLPKNLWLAVNEHGIHIMRRRAKEPLISYSYRNIVNYSPSLRNLMIVTESLTRGTKFVFNTSQASQIAHLIKDYTHIIIQRKQAQAQQPKQ